MTTKQCVTCRETKPVGEFYPRPDSRDRLQSRCKDCTKASVRASERRNVTRQRARVAARRACLRRRTPDWCLTGEAAEAIEDVYDLAALLTEIIGHKFVVDHIVPLAKGGEHRPDNLQPLRDTQNAAKHARLDWTPPPPVFRRVTYQTVRD